MPTPDTARSAPPAEPKRLVQVRLPVGVLAQVDALVGSTFEHRSQAIRTLIRAGLEAGGGKATPPAVVRDA